MSPEKLILKKDAEILHKRKDSLPNLGHQKFLEKLFDKDTGSMKRPEISNYRKEPEIYLNNDYKSRNRGADKAFNMTTVGGLEKMLVHDASV